MICDFNEFTIISMKIQINLKNLFIHLFIHQKQIFSEFKSICALTVCVCVIVAMDRKTVFRKQNQKNKNNTRDQ